MSTNFFNNPIIYNSCYQNKIYKCSVLHNPIVYSCIVMIAKSVASIPISVSMPDNTNEELYQHILNLINKPNKRDNISIILYKIVEDLLIYGHSYVLRNISLDEEMNYIYHILNKSVKNNIKNNTLVGYEYLSQKGWIKEKIDILGRCNILKIQYFSSGSSIYMDQKHISPCDIVRGDVELCTLIDEYNKIFVENCSKFNGILEIHNGTEHAIEKVRHYIQNNPAGAPLCFNNTTVDWKSTQSNNHIYDIECHRHLMKNIARVFGVPPILLGLQESSGHHQYESSRKHFWEDTVLPITIYILTTLQNWIDEYYTGIKLTAELNSVPALSHAWFEYAENINKLDFLTREEKRHMCNALFTGKTKKIQIE